MTADVCGHEVIWKMVLAHLKDITGPLLDPLQFAYRANRSVDDAVNMGQHYVFQHLDRPWTYVRILFVDFSSAFNAIINSTVTAVESFRFLGSTISQDLKWDNHLESIVKKTQQRLYFLRQLKKFNMPQELLKQFYSTIIESVLCISIPVWFSSATKSELRRLRRVVRTAERFIGTTLTTLQELYSSRESKNSWQNHSGPSHPAHSLCVLLPSGRR